MDTVIDFVDLNRERFVDELRAWVRIPSISALKEHTSDVERSATHIANELSSLGATKVEIWPTHRHPAVFASFMQGPDKPTLLIYGHHDVQPVEPLREWRTPPFEATEHEGRLYGRGTVDDKGQVFLHCKAIEAFLRSARGELPINIKLLIEGEEEIGSPHLEELLDKHRSALSADYVCVSDTAMYGPGIPSLCVGLRGLVVFELHVHGASSDVHSGSFGGAIANPGNVLARIIASFHDEAGRVLVPGFYEHVRLPSARERESLAKLPHDDDEWLKLSGALACVGEEGFSTLERIWTRPTLDVNSFECGCTGDVDKTIIPARAVALLSCRLVPDQDPQHIYARIAEHVRRVAPKGVNVEVIPISTNVRPYVADVEHPLFDAARRALAKTFDKDAVLMREGGSIAFVRTITEAMGKPTLLMGFGQPDECSHGPNEWLGLDNFHRGIKSAAWLYEELGRMREVL